MNDNIKKILFFLLLLTSHLAVNAQTAIEDYKNGASFFSTAAQMQQNNTEDDKQISEEVSTNYLKAITYFNSAQRKNTQFAPKSKYFMYACMVNLGYECKKQGNKYSQINYVSQAIDIWPEWISFNKDEITKSINISENGQTFIAPEVYESDYEENFSLGRYVAAAYYYDEADSAKMITNAEAALRVRCKPAIGYECAYDAAFYYYDKNNACISGHYGALAIYYASLTFKASPLDSHLRDMVFFCKTSEKSNCISGDSLGIVCTALNKLASRFTPDAEPMFLFADKAYNSGYHNNDFVFSMREYAGKQKDEAQSKKWEERLKKNESKYSYYDWSRLETLYSNIGDQKRADYYARKIERRDIAKKTHVMIGTNPYNFFINQYVGSIDIINRKISHGFRFNQINKAAEIVSNIKDKGNLPDHVTYSGYEISYAPKFLKSIGGDFFFYAAPELRYTHRNYLEDIQVATNSNLNLNKMMSLNANSNAYAITMDVGDILVSKWFYVEFYAGLGVGYRTLNTNLDKTTFTITDYRYKDDQWSRLFVPGRLGLRLGIVI